MFRYIWAAFCRAVVDRVQYRSVKIRFELTSYNITKTYKSLEVKHLKHLIFKCTFPTVLMVLGQIINFCLLSTYRILRSRFNCHD